MTTKIFRRRCRRRRSGKSFIPFEMRRFSREKKKTNAFWVDLVWPYNGDDGGANGGMASDLICN